MTDYREVDPWRRESGELFVALNSVGMEPVCLRGVIDFRTEMGSEFFAGRSDFVQLGLPEQVGRSRAIIQQERSCPHWRAYQRGVNPSLSLEIAMFESLERHMQEMQERREALQKKLDARRHMELFILAASGLVVTFLVAGKDTIARTILDGVVSWLRGN